MDNDKREVLNLIYAGKCPENGGVTKKQMRINAYNRGVRRMMSSHSCWTCDSFVVRPDNCKKCKKLKATAASM